MKSGVFALLAAILLAAVLIIGCIAPLGEFLPGGSGNKGKEAPTPNGKGAVRLMLNNESNARAVFPTAPDYFDTYRILFIGDEDNDTTPTPDYPNGSPGYIDIFRTTDETYTIDDIPAGEYLKIQVNALVGAAIVASGLYDTPFTIASGQDTPVTIALDWLKTSGTGTFTYDFTGTDSMNSASMAITPRGGGAAFPVSAIDIIAAPSSISALAPAAGVYNVTFTLQNATYPGFITVREVLYIYGGLSTHYEFAFLPGLFPKPQAAGSLVFQDYLDYTENPVDIPNPDRGFYKPHSEKVIVPSSSGGSTSIVPVGRLTYNGPDDETTNNNAPYICSIVHYEFNLARFSSNAYYAQNSSSKGETKPLDTIALNYIRNTLNGVRNNTSTSLVAEVRFKYDEDGWSRNSVGLSGSGYINGEPTGDPHTFNTPAVWDSNVPASVTQWVQYHIYQIKPILEEYEDIIMSVQGFFGPWGEMHSTTMSTNAANYVWLFDALLDAVPASRPVLAHAGGFLAWYNAKYGTNGTISIGTSYTFNNIHLMTAPERDSVLARFGMFNDSYSCGRDNNSDNGSLSEGNSLVGGSFSRNRTITWIRNQNNLYGGETNNPYDINYARFPFVAWEGPIAHTSHLNIEHDPDVLNIWKDLTYNETNVTTSLTNSHPADGQNAIYDPVYDGKNGLEFVRDRLGYRLVLREAWVSDPVARTGTLVFEGKIQNVGWGNVVNKKDVHVILKPKSGSGSYSVLMSLDARDWLAAADNDGRASNTAAWRDLNFTIGMSAFGTVPAGDYNIYLKIQDPKETTPAKRCIRFANKAPGGVAIWDSTLGANLIGSVTVTN